MAALYIVSRSHVIISNPAKQWRRGRLIRRDADEKGLIHLGLARLSGPCGPHAGSGHGGLPLKAISDTISCSWAIGSVLFAIRDWLTLSTSRWLDHRVLGLVE